ncbi:MAG: trehalose-phosphatase [Actinomycetota bacterium]
MPLRALRQRPERAALLTDFDGTLSEIVADPATARPVPGVVEILTRLTARLGLVGIVSGRPVEFLEQHLTDPTVQLVGLYGLEGRRNGERWEHPGVGGLRDRVTDLVERARAELPDDVAVESKGLGLTLHYRVAPEAEDVVRRWAADEAGDFAVRPAKRSIELHPPIDTDKGRVVEELAEGFDPIAFLGDDIGDLPAFQMLRDLRDEGRTVARVVVSSAEVPEALLVEADDVVAGPAAMTALLAGLAEA